MVGTFLFRLAILFFGWGWIVLGLIGILYIVLACRATRQMFNFSIAISLIVFAFFWQQKTQTLNFGVEQNHICTSKGDIKAFVRLKGFVNCFLVIQRGDNEQEIWLSSRVAPENIFWIQEGKTIGILYPDQHLIVDIDVLSDRTNINRKLSAEEERRLDYQRKLTPDEEKIFEDARQAND